MVLNSDEDLDDLFSTITVSCRDSPASRSKSSLKVPFNASFFFSNVFVKSDKTLGNVNFLPPLLGQYPM